MEPLRPHELSCCQRLCLWDLDEYLIQLDSAECWEPPSRSQGLECQSSCAICAAAEEQRGSELPSFSRPSPSAHGHEHASQWRQADGSYKSIMVIVSPCRSDMSPAG